MNSRRCQTHGCTAEKKFQHKKRQEKDALQADCSVPRKVPGMRWNEAPASCLPELRQRRSAQGRKRVSHIFQVIKTEDLHIVFFFCRCWTSEQQSPGVSFWYMFFQFQLNCQVLLYFLIQIWKSLFLQLIISDKICMIGELFVPSFKREKHDRKKTQQLE